MNLNEMPQYQKKKSIEEQKSEKAMQDIADLKAENEVLRNTQENMKREMDQLRKKLEEAKTTQKVVYRDRIVRAMAWQDCRKSEYEQEKLHQKKLHHMVRWLWGAVVLLILLDVYLLAR